MKLYRLFAKNGRCITVRQPRRFVPPEQQPHLQFIEMGQHLQGPHKPDPQDENKQRQHNDFG